MNRSSSGAATPPPASGGGAVPSWWLRTVAGAAAGTLLAGCGGAPGPALQAAPAAALVRTPPAPRPPASPPVPGAAALPPSAPVGLMVPAIGVHSGPLLDLGIDRAGALEAPPDATSVGWFTLGPTPGAPGPAVLAGHADHGGVPGVFARLADLAPGSGIRVRRADGTEAVFTAYRVERYAEPAFPTEDVYGDTAGPELRLITRGGSAGAATGRHRDNVVVYARLTGSR